MANESKIPEPGGIPHAKKSGPGNHRVNGLLIGGGAIAILFLLFIFTGGAMIDGAISPLWIGFAVGALIAGLGLFRLVRGPEAFGLGDVEHKHTDT